MARRSIKQFVKENYVLDFTVQGSCNGNYCNAPINVYRPKIMKGLPEELKEYVVDTAVGGYDDMGHRPSWTGHNPDYGRWDAFCAFRFLAHRTDVYICSILRRPFTKEQEVFYGNCALIMAPYRIYAPWDSAVDSPELRASVEKYMKENPKRLY